MVDVSKLDKLEDDVVVTLCFLEKYFPPSFFDIMVHPVVNFVKEVHLCGPVYFRRMYPFERYMKVLKRYVMNRTHPEGCIAEWYIAEEAVKFCTEHLSNVSTVGVPSSQKMGLSRTVNLMGKTITAYQIALNREDHMNFHGVIQDIWDLYYEKFTITVFRCDWIDSSSGLVVEKLGFTLVDLSKIGHKNDQFVMASQVKQVFFVHDLMHHGWSVVLSMPNREYNDVIGDDVLGDVRIECEPFTRGMPNVDTFDAGEFGSQNIRDGCEDIWIE
ncbi:unnamed protein product [Prunus armeniaca]